MPYKSPVRLPRATWRSREAVLVFLPPAPIEAITVAIRGTVVINPCVGGSLACVSAYPATLALGRFPGSAPKKDLDPRAWALSCCWMAHSANSPVAQVLAWQGLTRPPPVSRRELSSRSHQLLLK